MSKSNIKENIAILILIKFNTKSNNIDIIVIENCFYFFRERYSQNTSKADYFSYLTHILKKIQLFKILCVFKFNFMSD